MPEAELVSEWIVARIAGMQDKKKSLGDFYEQFGDSFPKRTEHEKRFRAAVEGIEADLGDEVAELEWHRAPRFRTVHCVTFHRMYGLSSAPEPRAKASTQQKSKLEPLRAGCGYLSYALESAKQTRTRLKKHAASFRQASGRLTT